METSRSHTAKRLMLGKARSGAIPAWSCVQPRVACDWQSIEAKRSFQGYQEMDLCGNSMCRIRWPLCIYVKIMGTKQALPGDDDSTAGVACRFRVTLTRWTWVFECYCTNDIESSIQGSGRVKEGASTCTACAYQSEGGNKAWSKVRLHQFTYS